jgi:hypothetical protein
LLKKCGNIKIVFFTTPSWRLPDLWGMPILTMQALSWMTRWINTLWRTSGILMFLWQFNFASHYDHVIDVWLMHEFSRTSQNNEQSAVNILWTNTILTYHLWGQFGIQCSNGMDLFDSTSKWPCWICGVPKCRDPVEE